MLLRSKLLRSRQVKIWNELAYYLWKTYQCENYVGKTIETMNEIKQVKSISQVLLNLTNKVSKVSIS